MLYIPEVHGLTDLNYGCERGCRVRGGVLTGIYWYMRALSWLSLGTAALDNTLCIQHVCAAAAVLGWSCTWAPHPLLSNRAVSVGSSRTLASLLHHLPSPQSTTCHRDHLGTHTWKECLSGLTDDVFVCACIHIFLVVILYRVQMCVYPHFWCGFCVLSRGFFVYLCLFLFQFLCCTSRVCDGNKFPFWGQ